ncbi:Glyoxylase, beta-lactamase superfamily II [Granulicella rosea]|uniref:Glyoxylase, beta-lactamase superfamily II n=1 Tax=Granulicella rosea TaxID=474952 RepID=A0A239GY01_9BACT|nr:MBL fold metallo-hydrolase [Granulicella rosea]SNS74030.1 Glyoxylase, beta-lactamase superfamily II [Granulicella rosea]
MNQTQTPVYNPALSGNPSSSNRAYPNGNPADPLNPVGAKNTDSVVPLHRTGEVTHDYRCDGPAPGTIGFRWIFGSIVAAKNTDPRVQVMQYNEDTYLMRENICVHWEGPFTYLLFGNKGALLIDTGATSNAEWYPLRKTVDGIIARWAKARGKTNVPLTVVMTSGEDAAQNQGLSQFVGRTHTRLAPKSLAEVKAFYKLESAWPAGTGKIDLGDRVIEVIPTPGSHRDGVSFYDPYCDILFTGDLIYPGKIQIGNDKDFVRSIERLKAWRESHPVKWILGGHVEMQFLPGKAYPRFYAYKPYERLLEMKPELIDDVLASAKLVVGKQMVLVRPDFQLLNGVSPDQKTLEFPAGVANINGPRAF